MERLEPGRGAVGAQYWTAPRASRYAAHVHPAVQSDPLFRRLRNETGRKSSVLDVGAGTGRFSLALAGRVAEVTAVDPSPAMLNVLRREAARTGTTNVRMVVGNWEDVDVPPADVSICSYVLPLVENAKRFLAKLDSATRQRAFLLMNAGSVDLLLDPLWRHFHGRPRRPSPTYLDAGAVLAELGVTAEVEVVEVRTRSRFETLDAAVKEYRDQLILVDSKAVRAELGALLGSWLIEDEGFLRPPFRSWPSAIVSWRPRTADTARTH
ncbi:MAG TPA: class I SAM-dependent methyltransferase [Acidimicrobiales bacterium]|nr:class I SAM-dependent methyltransferase [Acidimicrobiales bacterium]